LGPHHLNGPAVVTAKIRARGYVAGQAENTWTSQEKHITDDLQHAYSPQIAMRLNIVPECPIITDSEQLSSQEFVQVLQ
jgi:hypothetical protein